MTNFRWIAALLNATDIAPNPNRLDQETVDQPALLALLILSRTEDYLRFTGETPLPIERLPQVEPGPLCKLVSRVVLGQDNDTDVLALYEHVAGMDSSDWAELGAAALITAVLAGELDNNRLALDVLSVALDRIAPGLGTVESRIVYAALLQQQARRTHDGSDATGREATDRALEVLSKIDLGEVAPFEVAWMANDDYQLTVSRIVATLRESCSNHLYDINTSLSGEDFQKRLQQSPTWLKMRSFRWAADGYSKLVDRLFDESQASSESLARSDIGQDQLTRELMFFELYGSPETRPRRREMAAYNYYVGLSAENSHELVKRGIRLMRRGGDRRRLESTVARIRLSGPLTALISEAERIARFRRRSDQFNLPEMVLVRAAASLLPTRLAAQLLDVTFERRSYRSPARGGAWQAESIIIEAIWSTIVQLASPARRVDEVARSLLLEIQSNDPDDELLGRMFARIMDSLDWAEVSDETFSDWRAWASRSTRTSGLEEIRYMFFSIASRYRPNYFSEPDDFDHRSIAQLIDRSAFNFIAVPPDSVPQIAEKLRQDMGQRRHESGSGVHSVVGGPAAADVAVALCLSGAVVPDSLWQEISEFLTDPTVGRRDKNAALERLARSPGQVPRSVKDALASNRTALLDLEPDWFDSSITPYPAAVRALAALDITDEGELLTTCLEFSASSESIHRTESARILTTLLRSGRAYDWSLPLAFHLARDADTGTKSEAGRSLAFWMVTRSSQKQVVESELLSLIRQDGVLAPAIVLSALAGQWSSLSPEFQRETAAIAESHLDLQVRQMAKRVIDGAPLV